MFDTVLIRALSSQAISRHQRTCRYATRQARHGSMTCSALFGWHRFEFPNMTLDLVVEKASSDSVCLARVQTRFLEYVCVCSSLRNLRPTWTRLCHPLLQRACAEISRRKLWNRSSIHYHTLHLGAIQNAALKVREMGK